MEHSAGVTFEPLRSNHLAENVYCYVVEAEKEKKNSINKSVSEQKKSSNDNFIPETAGEAFVAEALVVGVVVGCISSCLAYSCESRPC